MFNLHAAARRPATRALPLVATAALICTPAVAQVWQAGADFSTVQGDHDWRYMTYVPGAVGAPGTYELMVYGPNFYNFDSWHRELLDRDFISWQVMHPGELEPARVWESPVAGTVRVVGTVWKADPREGDGVYATIWKNDTLLWDATIAYNDSVGVAYDLSTHVMPGDWLVFRVNQLGDSNSDSTWFDPRIEVQSLDNPSGSPWIADVLGALSTSVAELELSLFSGPTDAARASHRLALSHELQVASNRVSAGQAHAALQPMANAFLRLDGDPTPPDWMVTSTLRNALYEDVLWLWNLLRWE